MCKQAEGDILLKKEKYVDAVVGPQSYHQINDMILKIERKAKSINFTEFNVIDKFDSLKSLKFNNKISSFLTIQEGCDKWKFCVVPTHVAQNFYVHQKKYLKRQIN